MPTFLFRLGRAGGKNGVGGLPAWALVAEHGRRGPPQSPGPVAHAVGHRHCRCAVRRWRALTSCMRGCSRCCGQPRGPTLATLPRSRPRLHTALRCCARPPRKWSCRRAARQAPASGAAAEAGARAAMEAARSDQPMPTPLSRRVQRPLSAFCTSLPSECQVGSANRGVGLCRPAARTGLKGLDCVRRHGEPSPASI